MYTNSKQTAKLIELGLPKPKSIISAMAYMEDFVSEPCLDCERAYSIGELIEILPENLNGWQLLMHYSTHFYKWCAYYLCDGDTSELYLRLSAQEDELIDALYDMVLRLKEEGVI